MPRLSVILPVKNGQRYLGAAVRSTLRSLPADSELVVLNDGSSDSTAQILESFVSKKVRVFEFQESVGVSQGLNFLLDATDSEYVARMDADDLALPWRWNRQLRLAKKFDLVFTSALRIDSRGKILRPDLPGPIGWRSSPLHLMIANCFFHPSMLARRSSLPEGLYRPLASEDYDMWLRMVAMGKSIVRDAVPGILYREHDAQISSSKRWKDQRGQEADRQIFLKSYQDALVALNLPHQPPLSSLEFLLARQVPESEEGRLWVEHLLSTVAVRARNLPLGEKLILRQRIKSSTATLKESE